MKIALTEEQVAKILVEYFDREHKIKIEATAFLRSYSYSSDFCTLFTEKKMNYDWFLDRELYRYHLEEYRNERMQEELEQQEYELEQLQDNDE